MRELITPTFIVAPSDVSIFDAGDEHATLAAAIASARLHSLDGEQVIYELHERCRIGAPRDFPCEVSSDAGDGVAFG